MTERTDPVLRASGLVCDLTQARWSPWRRGTRARVLDGVDLDVAAAEVLVIVGQRGSGRTSLGQVVTGRRAPTAGTVTVDGDPVERRARGRVPRAVLLPADEATRLPRRSTVSAVVSGAPAGEADGAPPVHLTEILRLLGLGADILERRVDSLDAGERGRVLAARELAGAPALVVHDLDAHRDPVLREQVAAALAHLRLVAGTAAVVLADPREGLEGGADRVAVLDRGRVVEIGSPGSLRDHPLHPLTRDLLAGVAEPDAGDTTPAPQPFRSDAGCSFRDRCRTSQDVCAAHRPDLERPLGATHQVACHFPLELRERSVDVTDASIVTLPEAEPTAWEFASD